MEAKIIFWLTNLLYPIWIEIIKKNQVKSGGRLALLFTLCDKTNDQRGESRKSVQREGGYKWTQYTQSPPHTHTHTHTQLQGMSNPSTFVRSVTNIH